MMITDPIADMLTRIRNGLVAKHEVVEVPYSKMKKAIADILVEEGYVRDVEVSQEGVQGVMKVTLKYGPNNEKVISGIKRVSKPGLRVYAGADKLPKVLGGMGIAILSTSKGIMTGKQAGVDHIGGEVLAYVW